MHSGRLTESKDCDHSNPDGCIFPQFPEEWLGHTPQDFGPHYIEQNNPNLNFPFSRACYEYAQGDRTKGMKLRETAIRGKKQTKDRVAA